MMQAFRNAAKPVVYLLTITFLAWMIVDLSGITGSGGLFTQTSVGSINGQRVEVRNYQQAVEQAIAQRQQEQPGVTLGLDATQKIRDEVWEQFVQSAVLEAEYERRHLTTNPAEIAEVIRYNPPPQLVSSPEFQSEGRFDPAKYQAWLTSADAARAMPFLEADYRDRILRSKLYSTVVADVYLSDGALWDRWRYKTEAVRVNLTSIVPRNAVPDSAITNTAAEIEEYYKKHTETFRRNRTAFLSYIAVRHELDASDSAAALARAVAVRNEIRGGAPFADVAKRESTDRGSAQLGGDLGTFAKGTMVPEFDKAVFSLPLNTLSEPVLSAHGYHLIEVSKRWGTDSASARHILIPLELAGAHRDEVDKQADALEQIAADRLDRTALDTAAKELRLPIGQAMPAAEGTAVAVGQYVFPDAGVWAFRAKPGETSPVIDGLDAYYVFRLDSIQAAGVPPFADVRLAADRLLRDEKKEAQAAAIGADLLRRIAGGASLADASKALNLPNRDFGPFLRQNPPVPNALLIGAMFGTPEGKTSGLITTPQGLYVFKVLEKVKADSAAFRTGIEKFRVAEIGTMRQDRIREFEKGLRASAKIKDDRAALFNTTQAQTEAASSARPTTP